MAWIPIVQVNITLNTTGSTREGFGLPLFIANTDAFSERVRGYTSLEDVQVDFSADSPAYKAAVNLWSQTPKVTQLFIGRRALQYTAQFPNQTAAGTTYGITLRTSPANSSSTPQTQQFTYTALAADTAFEVLTALKAAIDADTVFGPLTDAIVAGTGEGASLSVSATDTATQFVVATAIDDTLISIASTADENPAQAVANIVDYNNDWYFVAMESRIPSEVVAMAAEIAGMKSHKIFFTATNDADALSGSDITQLASVDVAAQLAIDKRDRTVCLWHQTAGTNFPELAYIAYGAPYDAGSIAWGNAQLTNIAYSMQPGTLVTNATGEQTGRPLSSTHKSALEARNCNYIDLDGGVSVVRHGKVSSGEWIDIIRGRDWLEYDLTVSLRDLLVNQKGGKITYDDRGITRIRQVIETSLERAVDRNLLESYTVTIPRASKISVQDKRDRILKDVKFTGILAGAINDVVINGTVAYE